MGEIIPSESLSRVTYTGINSMHSQKTKKEKKKQPEDKQATRNMQKGENDIKEAQVEKGLRTSPHKSAQKWKEPSKW